jgi:hypothetical protein
MLGHTLASNSVSGCKAGLSKPEKQSIEKYLQNYK